MSEGAKDLSTPPEPTPSETVVATAPPDVELPYGLSAKDYWHFMDRWDMSEAQKIAWLIELAHIVKGFVDLGVGQDSVQTLLAQKFVDCFEPESDETPADSGKVLEQLNTKNFNQMASNDAGKHSQNE